MTLYIPLIVYYCLNHLNLYFLFYNWFDCDKIKKNGSFNKFMRSGLISKLNLIRKNIYRLLQNKATAELIQFFTCIDPLSSWMIEETRSHGETHLPSAREFTPSQTRVGSAGVGF